MTDDRITMGRTIRPRSVPVVSRDRRFTIQETGNLTAGFVGGDLMQVKELSGIWDVRDFELSTTPTKHEPCMSVGSLVIPRKVPVRPLGEGTMIMDHHPRTVCAVNGSRIKIVGFDGWFNGRSFTVASESPAAVNGTERSRKAIKKTWERQTGRALHWRNSVLYFAGTNDPVPGAEHPRD